MADKDKEMTVTVCRGKHFRNWPFPVVGKISTETMDMVSTKITTSKPTRKRPLNEVMSDLEKLFKL